MATKPDKILIRQIQLRRDTAENWILHDPILADGEVGVEREEGAVQDTPNKFKIGDGISRWTQLQYGGLSGPPGKDAQVEVSQTANNRLEKDTDNSLYVAELGVDLSDIYSKAKSGNDVNTEGLKPTESILTQAITAIGTDVKEVQESLSSATILTRQCGVTLSALKCVYEKNGIVYPLDYRDAENIDYFLGITISAGDVGSTVKVQRTGAITDSSWNFALGRVFLGINGALTQTPPEDGFDLLIGTALSKTRMLFNIQDPIEILEN